MHYLSILVIILVSTFPVFSQGVIINDSIKKSFLETFPMAIDKPSKEVLPSNFSLEKYIPQVYDQRNSGMCLAYAVTTCATMLRAKHDEVTDPKKIKEFALSPHDFYYQVAKNRYKWTLLMPKKNMAIFSNLIVYFLTVCQV